MLNLGGRQVFQLGGSSIRRNLWLCAFEGPLTFFLDQQLSLTIASPGQALILVKVKSTLCWPRDHLDCKVVGPPLNLVVRTGEGRQQFVSYY